MIKKIYASLWVFGIPKTPLDVIAVYPASLFATAHFAVTRTRLSLYWVGLAILWDMAMGFWLMIGAYQSPRIALLQALMRLKDCSYSRVGLANLLNADQRGVIESRSLLEYLGRKGLPWKHENDVKIFRVEVGPSRKIPEGLGAFNIPLIESMLLIRDDPSDSDVKARFFLWHEIGHTLGREFMSQSMLRKGVKSPLCSLLLSLLLVQWSYRAAAVAVLLAVALWILYRTYARLGKSLRFESECQADEFALEFMSSAEVEELKIHGRNILPGDGELTESERQLRLKRFQRALDKQPGAAEWRESNLLVFFLDSALAAINVAGWMVLLAMHFRPEQPRAAVYFAWSVLALAVLGILRFAKTFILGILADLILMGSRCWTGEKFDFRPFRQ